MKGEGRELGEILSSSRKPNVVPEVSLICFTCMLYIVEPRAEPRAASREPLFLACYSIDGATYYQILFF